jgi:predicted homoserine dehydrogenase-like protein
MSSVNRDGSWISHNTQEGVFVVVKATNDYVSGCFNEYPWHPDPTGQYAALYRPYHYVGLELNMSIANAALRGIPTGGPVGFYGDVVATAKKDLKAGEFLDGEGGFTVWGKLVSAKHSVATGALPVALAHHVELRNDVPKGAIVGWDDVIIDDSLSQALELRRETEALLATPVAVS